MKKTIKIISAVLICITVIMAASPVFALNTSEIDTDNSTVGSDKIKSVGSTIATILRNVGIVVAVVILMVLGLKYMMGSAEEKAEYKKTMIPYVVGAALLFGASAIAGEVVDMTSNIV